MRTPAPTLRIASPRLSLGVLATVLLIHASIVAGLLALKKPSPNVSTPPAPLYVQLIETEAAIAPRDLPPPAVQPALSPPAAPAIRNGPSAPPKPAVAPAKPAPQPLPAAPAPAEPAQPALQPAPQPAPTVGPPPAPVEPARAPPTAPLPVTQPRFNADYLDNPKPPYPSASRRMGEEGEVRLRVHVDISGSPGQIEIFHGSGYPRLDQAAMDTVRQWRFVPARQGDQPIPAWIIVPIQFNLRS